MTASEIIAKARSYKGTTEKYNNNVIFNTAYYGYPVNGSAYAWCAVFVWFVFKECGASSLYYGGGKTAYCPTLMQYYKSHKQFYTTPKVGDIVFYNFSKGKTAQHVGIVTEVSSTYIKAVEGNTSSSDNTNGGCVEEKARSLSVCLGFARPNYATTKETTMYTATVNTNKDNLNVRVGAGTGYKIASAFPSGLPKGMKVTIDQDSNGWSRLADTGLWVYSKWLKKV